MKYKNNNVSLLCCILLALLSAHVQADACLSGSALERGVIDLNCWDVKSSQTLEGEWAFSLQNLQGVRSDKAPAYFDIQRSWREQGLPPRSEATYRLTLRLDQPRWGLTLKTGRGYGYYTVSIKAAGREEKLLYSNVVEGRLLTPKALLNLPPVNDRTQIILRLRNEDDWRGGMTQAPVLAGESSYFLRVDQLSLVLVSVLAGGYGFMFLYNLALWLGYRSKLSFLLLSLCCLAMALRTLLAEGLLSNIWPNMPQSLNWLIAWGSFFCLSLLLSIFAWRRFTKPWLAHLLKVQVGLCLIAMPLMYLGLYYFTPFALSYLLLQVSLSAALLVYLSYGLLRRSGEFIRFDFLCVAIVALSFLCDVFLRWQGIPTDIEVTALVLLVFIIGQSFAIARRYTLGQEAQRHLSDELQLLNASLESRVAKRTEELKRLNGKLQALSMQDSLTNLPNRRAFDERLNIDVRRAQRQGQALSLLVADLDLFKLVNDGHGHDVGDQVLIEAAKCMSAVVRESDMVARIGGEEFAILLPDTDAEGAMRVAEHLRVAVESLSIESSDGEVRPTVSIGCAVSARDLRHRDFFRAADQALYQAKRSGRNKVCLASDLLAEATV